MKQLFFVLLASILLTSCGHYADGTSVWAGGLFIIPLLTFAGGCVFTVQAYIASKSNSTKQTETQGTLDNTGNVPIYKIGRFYFGMALFLATLIIIIMINADK